jgi:hypothetical protein
MEPFLTPVLSALGALAAAWLGTRLGLRKFRAERAFDARLEWHRNLAETAKVLRNRTLAFKSFTAQGVPEQVAVPLVQELGALSFKFQELAEVASLYASKSTCSAIGEVMAQMNHEGQAFISSRGGNEPSRGDSHNQMFTASVGGMERVYELLARDLRDLLGLERL